MKQFWKSMLKSPSGVIGLVILVLAISVALFGPMLFPNSPWRMVQRPFLPPFTLSTVPLGTDALGRDVFAGMIFGARVSLLVGLVSTLVALVVGMPIGAMAGYFGGRVDDALMRFTEFFQTIPSFALAIVLVAILQPSIVSIVLAIAIVSWPPVARLVRGEVLSLRTREYVQAAIVTGHTNSWIIWREILPNALSPVIVLASLMVATAILLALRWLVEITTGPLGGWIGDRFGAQRISIANGALLVSGFVLIALDHELLGALVVVMTRGMFNTLIPVLVLERGKSSVLSSQASYSTWRDFGAAVGPLSAPWLFLNVPQTPLYAALAAALGIGAYLCLVRR